eukprot:m.67806 g.67806  ORF g.67806 m.67806 type:complete len:581 (-) comp19837_c1_seq1:140-1882(-)
MGDELYPIAVLIDELKDEDVQIRLNSVRRLSTIALALGEERTRSELIPFLSESLDDEDEVLLAVAEELCKFVPLVGGGDYAHTLLAPLEILAQVEETVVRDKAVEALCLVAEAHSAAHLKEHFFPLVQRMGSGDWFAARASACGLFASAYKTADPALQEEMRKLFHQLCQDDTPMVRRSAAGHLGKLASQASPDVVKKDMLQWFQLLVSDEQDSVRLLAVEACMQFSKILPREDVLSLIVPQLQSASKDRSWRVRYVVADKYLELQEAVGADVAKADLIPILSRLLQDQEAEVRTQAILKLPEVAKGCSADDRSAVFSSSIMPHVGELCADGSQHVRVAVASVLMELAPIVGKQHAIDHIVPLFIRLLKDDQSDVRLNVISKLDVLQGIIGVDQVTNVILPEIVLLATDQQWRVRLAIIEQLPMLAKVLGNGPFDSKLTPLCLSWLVDSVYAIRQSTTKHLDDLVQVFGLAWAKKSIIPKIVHMGQERAYIARLTTLFALATLAPHLDADTAAKDVLPVVLKLATDSVPNVRFNAARTLGLIKPQLDNSIFVGKVKPVLEQMTKDGDGDVKFYSEQALSA